MSMTRKIAGGTVIGVLTIWAGTVFALSTISLTLGSLPSSYDFGTVNLTTGDIDPVGTKPATVQFHTFTVKPGETFDWHYHKAVAYVVIEHGTLSERHINETAPVRLGWRWGRIPHSWKTRRGAHGDEYGERRGGGHMGHSLPDRGRSLQNSASVHSRRRLSSPERAGGATESLDQVKPRSGVPPARMPDEAPGGGVLLENHQGPPKAYRMS